MFCPNCGTADQKENSYCRNCGEFLMDSSKNLNLIYSFLGITTPEKQLTLNLIINFLGLLLCVTLIGFLKGYYDAGETKNPPVTTPNIIYFVYAFLILIAAWQILGIVFAANLRSKFNHRKANKDSENKISTDAVHPLAAKTREALPTAKFDDLATRIVTEDTTRNLGEKIPRSSQTEQ